MEQEPVGRDDRVVALAKIAKLLGGGAQNSSTAVRRHEVERKQAAVSGQSRGAVRIFTSPSEHSLARPPPSPVATPPPPTPVLLSEPMSRPPDTIAITS